MPCFITLFCQDKNDDGDDEEKEDGPEENGLEENGPDDGVDREERAGTAEVEEVSAMDHSA